MHIEQRGLDERRNTLYFYNMNNAISTYTTYTNDIYHQFNEKTTLFPIMIDFKGQSVVFFFKYCKCLFFFTSEVYIFLFISSVYFSLYLKCLFFFISEVSIFVYI